MSEMRKRLVTAILLLVWIGLIAIPLLAAGSHHCPVCSGNVCPMHTPTAKHQKFSCHQESSTTNCSIRATACDQETNTAVFFFHALLPNDSFHFDEQTTPLRFDSLHSNLPTYRVNETPPPRAV